ncbi:MULTISPECIES: Flp pilus assembly protein CpaB [unclassified Mesorhizobium]|uniref:Flp pilus assembly protein CpaB n=1 Tax=unclassified Mesorhizobium TaxID=325217 RepID=UPI0003CE8A3F|nr:MULTISPECIES: Flp pilus assembly protein CpaB [unclassified Mesorhizobium]ESY51659.1 Flp pilus assembly protein CpaB [Mesorhizobium sp. LNJC374B00]ESY58545.1 Flp pilus assembly protein CpaB [Mesorhizobium sp. LNJC372A00]ESZ54670.1 Flp pilus assembly protein CpaB [Mesorhizobium sp. L103C120A0]ESZ64014.1 Flp pilus assembly protein CpaB [Mesorhizobium sp. L103C131B0]WJI42664.1 Flp pilus assembly protein CpaB [Mesorhizobium sp. C120A]
MKSSTTISLLVSVALALLAVFGVRSYLANQRDILAQRAGLGEPASEETILVATRALRFGEAIKSEDVRALAWPTGELPAGAFRKPEDLLGKDGELRYVMSAMEKDEPVLASKITGPGQRATLSAALGEGMKAVSIRVNDVLGVAGFVLPGDRVDIMLTRVIKVDSGADQTFVDVLLQGVKVLAADQTADDRTDKVEVVKTVTFEVTTTEAQKLTLAANVGTLSLALRNVASSGVEQTQPVTLADLGGGPMAQALKNDRADQDESRLTDLEKLVKSVGDTLGNRLGAMEDKLKPKTVPAEPAEPVLVAAPKPDFVVIGVSRNMKREEYRVHLLD